MRHASTWLSGCAFHCGSTTTAARGLFLRSRLGANRRAWTVLFSIDGVVIALVHVR
jgi:hypothetical protein